MSADSVKEKPLREALRGVMPFVRYHTDFDYDAYQAAVAKVSQALAAQPEPPRSENLRAAQETIVNDILIRIAKRYKNCTVNIYPDLPELTPVEAVLRCAAEEGFMLAQKSTLAAQPEPGETRTFEQWKDSLPKCSDECDGDLPGEEHDTNCPMYGKKWATLRDAYEAGRAAGGPANTKQP